MKNLPEELTAQFRELIVEFRDSSLVDISSDCIAKSLELYFKELEECILGGKLTRVSKFLSYACVDESNIQKMHVYFCAALEFFQTAILVHDDIIDGDAVRRGRPTSRITLGENEALLLGDFVLSAASWCFSKAQVHAQLEGVPLVVCSKLADIWHKMHRDVILGQVLDAKLVNQPLNQLLRDTNVLKSAAADARKVVRLKTASYTTVAPAVLGLTLRGADDARVEAKTVLLEVRKGVEFQQDNDFKDLQKDIQTGKVSALIVELLEKLLLEGEVCAGDQSILQLLEDFANSERITPDQVDRLRELLERRS
ncbi:MAG: polyprenyl synthetase family protein [Candidatus Ancillula trichonymphae]|jgi:geranylgeranyl diphosphate synthase type I|nr:polyprenyl synthetase family protein [Candidatus Ancillula trichonymphae]